MSRYPRLKMCISTQSRSHLNPIQVSGFVSHLYPGSRNHVSYLSQLNLTSIQVRMFPSPLHPGNISLPSRSAIFHLSSIQASSQTISGLMMRVSPPSRSFPKWRIESQLHPSHISRYPRLTMCILNQSVSHHNPIQVHRFMSRLHQRSLIHVLSLSLLNLNSIQVIIFAYHLHQGNISAPDGSTKLHLSSIQSSSQTHTGFKRCVNSIPVLSQLGNCISVLS